MNRRTSYIAAAALAIAGTAGMASWFALDAGAPRAQAQTLLANSSTAQPGVAETEAVLPAVRPVETAQPLLEQPAAFAPPAVARAPRTERTARTPIAPAPAAQPERRDTAVSNPEPGTNGTRTEPVEPSEPAERVEPAEPRSVEVNVPAGTVLGVKLSTSISSDTA